MGAKSKNTTWAGIAAILGGVTLIVNMFAEGAGLSFETITTALGMIGGGVGLILAKDKNVTGAGKEATTVN